MSKDLEALKTLKDMLIGNGVNDNINDYVDNLILPVKQALLELKSIKEANPSKALEETLRDIAYDLVNDDNPFLRDRYYGLLDLKQALLKAQEPKHYLKWEDLEPFEEDKEIFGLLNGNKYILHTYRDSKHKYVLISLKSINMATLCDLFKQDIDFFNDLHLERVEE